MRWPCRPPSSVRCGSPPSRSPQRPNGRTCPHGRSRWRCWRRRPSPGWGWRRGRSGRAPTWRCWGSSAWRNWPTRAPPERRGASPAPSRWRPSAPACCSGRPPQPDDIGILTIAAAAVLTVVLGIRHAAGPYWAAAGAHVLHVLIDGCWRPLWHSCSSRSPTSVRGSQPGCRQACPGGRSPAGTGRAAADRTPAPRHRRQHPDRPAPPAHHRNGGGGLRRRCADDIEAIDAAPAEAGGQSAGESSVDDLLARLARLVEQRRALGLRIHVRIDRVPGDGCDLPPATAEAFTAPRRRGPDQRRQARRPSSVGRGRGGAGQPHALVTDDGPGIPDQRTRTELAARYRRVYAEPGSIVSALEPVDVGTRVSARWSAAGGVEHGLPAAVLPAVGADADLDHLRLRMRLVVACAGSGRRRSVPGLCDR